MTLTAKASLFDAAIEQAVRLVGHCGGTEAATLPETIAGFERLVDQLQALGLLLPRGDAMVKLVRESRRDFVRGERRAVRYDLARRVVKPLKAARDEAVKQTTDPASGAK
jgi:hypothetical protein